MALSTEQLSSASYMVLGLPQSALSQPGPQLVDTVGIIRNSEIDNYETRMQYEPITAQQYLEVRKSKIENDPMMRVSVKELGLSTEQAATATIFCNGYMGGRTMGEDRGTIVRGVYRMSPSKPEEVGKTEGSPTTQPVIHPYVGMRMKMGVYDQPRGWLHEEPEDEEIDLLSGVVRKTAIASDNLGSKIKIITEEIISQEPNRMHVGSIRTTIIPLSLQEGRKLTLSVDINGQLKDDKAKYLSYGYSDEYEDGSVYYISGTDDNEYINVVASKSSVKTNKKFTTKVISDRNAEMASRIIEIDDTTLGEPIVVDTKWNLHTSEDKGIKDKVGDTITNSKREMLMIPDHEVLRAENKKVFMKKWMQAYTFISGDEVAHKDHQLMLINTFHLMQIPPYDPQHPIGPKGPTKGYNLHKMWDEDKFAELYYILVHPEIAKNEFHGLFLNKEGMEDKARSLLGINEEDDWEKVFSPSLLASLPFEQAKCPPWETDTSGYEMTPAKWKNPDGTIGDVKARDHKVHQAGDLAGTIMYYEQATGDTEYMRDEGAEMIVGLAAFSVLKLAKDNNIRNPRNISSPLTTIQTESPDEYPHAVNGSTYTAFELKTAIDAALELPEMFKDDPVMLAKLQELGLTRDTLEIFKNFSDNIELVYKAEIGTFEQFRGSEERSRMPKEVLEIVHKGVREADLELAKLGYKVPELLLRKQLDVEQMVIELCKRPDADEILAGYGTNKKDLLLKTLLHFGASNIGGSTLNDAGVALLILMNDSQNLQMLQEEYEIDFQELAHAFWEKAAFTAITDPRGYALAAGAEVMDDIREVVGIQITKNGIQINRAKLFHGYNYLEYSFVYHGQQVFAHVSKDITTLFAPTLTDLNYISGEGMHGAIFENNLAVFSYISNQEYEDYQEKSPQVLAAVVA